MFTGNARHGFFTLALIMVPHRLVYWYDVRRLPEQFILSQDNVLTVNQLIGHELNVVVDLPFQRAITAGFSLFASEGSPDLFHGLPDLRTQAEVKSVLQRIKNSLGTM